jgi:predicted ATPase/DNA-binding SARP family transcriptional activator/class 3 adenylate cyclase
MEFRVLGVLEALADGVVLPLGGPKQRSVLAMLLVDANRAVSTDHLYEGLWGDDLPLRAAATLRVYVSNLRKVLEPTRDPRDAPTMLLTQPTGYLLAADPERVDAQRFERMLGEARTALQRAAAPEALQLLDTALALWRGPAWGEFASAEFARAEATRLDDLRLVAIEERVDARLALGHHAALVGELEALVADHPFRERLWGQLMLALYRGDRQAEALRAFGRLRRVLGDELGIEPSMSLRTLEESIVLQSGDLAWTPLPATALSPPAVDTVTSGPPSGTVTFLFTDIEGSARLWDEHPDEMDAALARHDAILHDAIAEHGGHVVKSTGDGVHAAFGTSVDAVAAAVEAQLGLAAEPWPGGTALRVRMGLHTGEGDYRDGDYSGPALDRSARLAGVAHGGQVVMSRATGDIVRDRLPPGVDVCDLGEHRLRDLARPEHVYQVLHERLPRIFPRLGTLDAFPGNLPVQLTSFIGRVAEMEAVAGALAESRLVTLTGVGGVGKTRLAVQVAAELLTRFNDGAWLCELATASDDGLMFHTVGDAIGARQREGLSMADSVVEFLRDRELLVILDNCEHLLVAAAQLVSEILQGCPGVRVLATSREGLGVLGERIVALGPLPLPDITDDGSERADSEAILLFAERAASARAGFTLDDANLGTVAEICLRLDGIPLAIELAAARVTAMSPAEISAHLDERFRLLTGGQRGRVERHQTLRATVEWSYALLDTTERLIFLRLGVFVGTFDVNAAAGVVGDGRLERWDVLDALTGLVEKSMVNAEATDDGATRYSLLETLRAFARDKLDATGQTDRWRRRHAQYYAEFCERVSPLLLGPDELESVRRVDAEIDNVWTALQWGLEVAEVQEDADVALRIIIGLTIPPGIALGRVARWGLQVWAERFLAAARLSALPQRAQAIALVALLRTNVLYKLSDLDEPEALAWEALRTPTARDAPPSIALSYFALASVRYREGRPGDAQDLIDEAHRALDAAGAASAAHGALHGLSSTMHAATGDLDAARREADTYIDIARATGSRLMLQAALAFAGRAWFRADPDRALRAFEEAIAMGDIPLQVSNAMSGAAQLRARSGDRMAALAHLRHAFAVDHSTGARANLGFTVESAIAIFTRLGDDELAAMCAGIVQANVISNFRAQPQTDRAAARVADRLPSDAFEAAYARGACLTPDQVAPTLLAALDELLERES